MKKPKTKPATKPKPPPRQEQDRFSLHEDWFSRPQDRPSASDIATRLSPPWTF